MPLVRLLKLKTLQNTLNMRCERKGLDHRYPRHPGRLHTAGPCSNLNLSLGSEPILPRKADPILASSEYD